jgi:V8-like Glu-specific endopeptidase
VFRTLFGVARAGRISRSVVAVAALTAVLAASGGTAQAESADVALGFSGRTPGAVSDYWTPERMKSAIPIGAIPASSRTGAATPRRGNLHTRVRKVRRFPRRTHGRVFFTMGGLNYVCSGTVIDAPNRSLIWTAGHCVYDPGLLGAGFATNWEFVPAYQPGGKAPFGEWPAVELGTTGGWKNASFIAGFGFDPRFDLGTARLAANPSGRKIQAVVGARGIAFNQSRDRFYRAYGYPAVRPPAEFNGERMFRCSSSHSGDDNSVGSPPPIRITCDMTGGASGGGWITRGGKLVSVTSYAYEGAPNSLYGPYMGNAARALYKAASD